MLKHLFDLFRTGETAGPVQWTGDAVLQDVRANREKTGWLFAYDLDAFYKVLAPYGQQARLEIQTASANEIAAFAGEAHGMHERIMGMRLIIDGRCAGVNWNSGRRGFSFFEFTDKKGREIAKMNCGVDPYFEPVYNAIRKADDKGRLPAFVPFN